MNEIISCYKKWKSEHDEDYCYDEIHDFIAQMSRGDLLEIMNFVESKFTSDNKE